MSAELAMIQQVKNQTVRVPTALIGSAANTNYIFPIQTVLQSRLSNIKVSSSGAVTAGTLKTALTVTGAGCLQFVLVTTTDNTPRTLRTKITLDGNVVYDYTTGNITSADAGIHAIGAGNNTNMIIYEQVFFNRSCLVEFASSLSETDKQNIHLKYQLF